VLARIVRPPDVLATQLVGFSQAVLEFLLDVNRHLQSQRADALNNQR
jgi:hypothetical protein